MDGTGFDDSAWASGPAQLGYNGGHEATVVSYGGNASSKYITTYFRRHFDMGAPSTLTNLFVSVQRDDGVVVYVNGNEVFRDNMPAGAINYRTIAPLSVSARTKLRSIPVRRSLPRSWRQATTSCGRSPSQWQQFEHGFQFGIESHARCAGPPH